MTYKKPNRANQLHSEIQGSIELDFDQSKDQRCGQSCIEFTPNSLKKKEKVKPKRYCIDVNGPQLLRKKLAKTWTQEET